MRKLALLALSLFGLFDSLYLWWAYTSNRPIVCTSGGCDAVRASVYAHIWGQATPVYGVVMYGAFVLLLLVEPLVLSPALRHMTRLAVAFIGGIGVLVSIYLSALEAFVIHAWCAWCVASAITVTLILLVSLWRLRASELPPDPGVSLREVRKHFVLVLVALAAGAWAFSYLANKPEINTAPPPAADWREDLVRPDSHMTGNLRSPVTMVEFGDFQCPICGAAQPAVEKILAKYGDRIRFVFRQFPLTQIHIHAETAAEASECAAQQGKFWEAEKKFYQQQADLSEPALDRYAQELGLDTRKFDECLSSGAARARVAADVADGQAAGVNATPTFFVGDQKIVGPPPVEKTEQLIEQELASHNAAPSATGQAGSVTPVAEKPPAQAKTPENPPPKQVSGDAGPGQSAPSTAGGSGSAAGGLASPGAGAFGGFQNSELACNPNEAPQKQPVLIGTGAAQLLFDMTPKALFVDVRSAADFAGGHIPGAVNIPVEEISQQLARLPKDQTIVLYESGRAGGSPDDVCAMGRAAGRVLLDHGFSSQRVKVYQDGLAGWQKAGLPVEQ